MKAAVPTPIKLIYIAGYGRSGTTLLDIALGEQPAIMGAGEVSTLARHVWNEGEYCACGARVRDCTVWRSIVERWREGEPASLMGEYRKAQERTESIIGLGRIFGPVFGRGGRREHARRTMRLLTSMAAISGRPVLLDSSKLPGRAFALASLAEVDLYVVHVVRDGRGVAWSLLKGHRRQADKGVQRDLVPKPLLYTAIRWTIVNLATEWLCRRLGPSHAIRVRYEDFVADPQATIGAITALVGEVAQATPGDTFAPQHQVAGSRHRMQRSITVRKDETWKTEMPRAKRIVFTLACAPLLRRYGYALNETTA